MIVFAPVGVTVEFSQVQDRLVFQLLHHVHDGLECQHVLLLHLTDLHCEYFISFPVHAFPHNAIGSFAKFFQDFVLLLEGILEIVVDGFCGG